MSSEVTRSKYNLSMAFPTIWALRFIAAVHVLLLFKVYKTPWPSPSQVACSTENSETLGLEAKDGNKTYRSSIEGHDDSDPISGNGLDEKLIDKCKQFYSNGSGESPKSFLDGTSKLFPCDDFTPQRHFGQRGSFWVLYNYVKPERTFRCDQSITYTTHTDWTFLDNLQPLLERWQGPVSLTLHAAGYDFEESLKRILYLRECTGSTLVKEFVTFHIFFHQHHFPKTEIPEEPEKLPVDCSVLTRTLNMNKREQRSYIRAMNLTYPINIARNVAKEMATTHYVLPCDIELYPSPNLIPDFMEMLRLNETALQVSGPKVFVLSHFELEASVNALPNDKQELVQLLERNQAIPFHNRVCPPCHNIPKSKEWQEEPVHPTMGIFHTTKRARKLWEPFYIGTKFDPMYDERLSWEGKKDKMVQNYVLCLLDYDFHILNNAFLVHRPGIKNPVPKHEKTEKSEEAMHRQYYMIDTVFRPELEHIYGKRSGCDI